MIIDEQHVKPSYYVDPIYICELALDPKLTDEQKGLQLQQYIQHCRELYDSDSPFPIHNIALYLATSPSELNGQIKKFKRMTKSPTGDDFFSWE